MAYLLHENEIRCVTAGRAQISADYFWGPGIREQYVIQYVINGKGFVEYSDRKYELSAGDSFIIFPNTPIFYYPDKDDPWEYAWVDFVGEDAEAMVNLTEFSIENPVIKNNDKSPLDLMLSLARYKKAESPKLMCKSKGLLYQLFSHYIIADTPLQDSSHITSNIDKAVEYIENSYHRPELTITEISKFMHMSRSTLFRIFKKRFNTTPIKYISEVRINNAKNLLASSDLSIKSIAFSVGFTDQLYFSKAFRLHTGMAPSEYKNSLKKDDCE